MKRYFFVAYRWMGDKKDGYGNTTVITNGHMPSKKIMVREIMDNDISDWDKTSTIVITNIFEFKSEEDHKDFID